ncbi:MAG: TIGR04255 family protein [Candidatus Omnitrophica bacterium]|nr:TIGR04255 family protein [Candidatus Omnitrophota bacterium]MDD5592787.1 TIGR04255 family protein [Candidatus Omnitrophota bacterium]
MSINEVFPNPTVKQVIFQIKFPNLFSIENKIGDFQAKIINEFPESSLVFRKQIVFADIGPEGKIEQLPGGPSEGQKIWQFKSEKKIILNVLTSSLDLTSNYHKTYNNKDATLRFRDTIKLVLDNFFSIVKLPIIQRIGLRYIDECPVPARTTATFKEWYNTVFPFERFSIEETMETNYVTLVKRNGYFVRYLESFNAEQNKYILDFDSYAQNIKPEDSLGVVDKLHELISAEFEKTIKAPVIEYMKKDLKKEEAK